MYSTDLLTRFHEPNHAGDADDASVVVTEGSSACGDVVQIGLTVRDGLISEARFRTLGCPVAIASSEAICELVEGDSPTMAELLTLQSVIDRLGGLPDERHQCASAPLAALRSALRKLDQVR